MREWKQFLTTIREWKMVAKALVSKDHPILAHIIPIRRCNLACTYCNEYDDFSDPISVDVMCERLDRLADLGTAIVTISGGEPLMHPELEAVIERIRERGMLAGLISNGYLMSRKRIQSLNAAGIDTNVFQGHSLRSSGATTTKASGVPIHFILYVAG